MNIKQLLLENKKTIIACAVCFVAGALIGKIIIPLVIILGGIYLMAKVVKKKPNEPKVVKAQVVKE